MKVSLLLTLIVSAVVCLSASRILPEDHDYVAEPTDHLKGIPLNIYVDPRLELLSVVQILCDYRGFGGRPLTTTLETKYRKDALKFFSPFKDHDAVKIFSEMSIRGFWYAQPPRAMLYLSNPPELIQKLPADKELIRVAGGPDSLDLFFDQLRLFSRKSNFSEFFLIHQADYEEMVRNYRAKVKRDFTKDVEDYFGYQQNGYHILLAPLFASGGYGSKVEVQKGFYDVYNIVGPRRMVEGKLDFGSEQDIARTTWHEFSHSFVNDIVHSHLDQLLEPCTFLQESKKEEIESIGFPWEDYIWEWVNEHVVRGVTTRLTYINYGKVAGETRVTKEKRQGYTYVDSICRSLETYELNWHKYTNFQEYFPEIIRVFRELAEEGNYPVQ